MLSDCIYIQRTMNIGHRILFIDLKYLMNKTLLTGLLCCTLTVQSFADQPLEGFTYATLNAPTGAEWESPENLALNKEQPHAISFRFKTWKVLAKYCQKTVSSGSLSMATGSFIGHPTPIPVRQISIRRIMM